MKKPREEGEQKVRLLNRIGRAIVLAFAGLLLYVASYPPILFYGVYRPGPSDRAAFERRKKVYNAVYRPLFETAKHLPDPMRQCFITYQRWWMPDELKPRT